ncbi:hypothetical protein BJX61DRAFT_129474 [Aspergillus egyptiacus]|nr:hypothetical protein BJX61DRAFT_129474 [Aspergillus egyptiacus]
MMWRKTFLTFISILSLSTTAANGKYHFASSSFYTSILTNFLQSLDLTNCPLNASITLPISSLPEPSEGLVLESITLGRGTQNYTCATNTNTSAPEAAGATATLFDLSCLAALKTDADDETDDETQSPLHILPDMLKSIPLSSVEFIASLLRVSSGQDLVIGKHYFTADGEPFFDLRGWDSDSKRSDFQAYILAEKEDDSDAPEKPGYGITGDVAWLKLKGVEGGFSEVYRVHTAGGSPPSTCEGMPEVFTVDYTAEYWFYA